MSSVKVALQNPILNNDVINHFIDGVVKTISTVSGKQVESLEPKFIYQFKIECEVAGVVGISNKNDKGLLILSFEKDCIIFIHNKMLNEKAHDLAPSVVDIVGELTNIVYGTVKTSLNAQGFQFQMALPTIIHGSFQLTKKSLSPTIVVPFIIDNKYKFSIALSVE